MRSFLQIIFAVIFLTATHPANAQISADHWLGGAVRVGPSVTACHNGAEGAIQYDSNNHVLKFCDGAAWRSVGATVPGSDNTPAAFSFTNLTGQALGSLVYSNTVTVTGIDPDVVTYVTGAGSPQISINGGSWSNAGLISTGDTLQLRQVTAPGVSADRIASVTVGTFSTNWTVTTRAGALLIFYTHTSYTGNFGGLAAADAICQSQAATYSKPGTYKAFLSDGVTSASSRLTFAYPIVNIAGQIIFSTDILNQSQEANILRVDGDPTGQSLWTGIAMGGGSSPDHCSGWTSASGNGLGTYSWIWLSNVLTSCGDPRQIICLQQ